MSLEYAVVVAETESSSVSTYRPDGTKIGSVAVGWLPHEIDVSPDGKTAYVANYGLHNDIDWVGVPGTSISVIDLEHMVETHRLYTFDQEGNYYEGPHSVALTPDGKKLFVNVEVGHKLLMFDLQEGQKCKRHICNKVIPLKFKSSEFSEAFPTFNGAHYLRFSPNGDALWVMASADGIARVDPETGEVTGHIPIAAKSMGLLADYSAVVVGGFGVLTFFDPHTLQQLRQFKYDLGVILYPEPTPDGKYLVCPAVHEQSVLIIDVMTGEIISQKVVGLEPIHIAITKNGEYAYVTCRSSDHFIQLNLKTFAVKKIWSGSCPNGVKLCNYYSTHKHRAKLVFGAVLPLSGANSTYGSEMMYGYEFWRESVNNAGGILVGDVAYTIENVFLDNRSVTANTEKLYEELINQHHVQFLLGTYLTDNIHAAKVAESHKVPLLVPTGASSEIFSNGSKYTFGVMAPSHEYLKGAIEVAVKQTPSPKSVVIMSDDDPAALENSAAAAQFASQNGLKVIEVKNLPSGFEVEKNGVIKFSVKVTDFEGAVKAIKDANPDLLLAASLLSASEGITKAAQKLNFAPQGLVFAVGPSLPKFSSDLGNTASFLIGASQWSPAMTINGEDRFWTPQKFYDRFWTRYTMKPSYIAASAVAAGIVFENAIRIAAHINRESVRGALATTDITTFFGPIKFDQSGKNIAKKIPTIQLVPQQGGGLEEKVVWPAELGVTPLVWPFPGWKTA